MSKFEEPKSAIDRVVVAKGHHDEDEEGGLGETKEHEVQAEVGQLFAKTFSEQDFKDLRALERPPKPEELEIFALANRATNKLLNQYGLGNFDWPAANIHVIPKDKWPEVRAKLGLRKGDSSAYIPHLQAVFCEEDASRLSTLEHSAHEMIHAKAFQSQNALYYEDIGLTALEKRRSGLESHSATGNTHFQLLDEAIAVELEKRVVEEARRDPLFEREVRFIDRSLELEPDLRKKDIYAMQAAGVEVGDQRFVHVKWRTRPYLRPRVALNKIIDALYENNKDNFQDREAVFALFANAALTGQMIPLGRVIEKTYGPGTFRELGVCETAEDLEDFAKSLKV